MVLTNDHIEKVINKYFSGKPVRKVWLFGSYARGEANEESDIDVLLDFEENTKVGLRYLTWHEELETLINKKVQVVSNDAVSKYLRPFIDADKKLLYEKLAG